MGQVRSGLARLYGIDQRRWVVFRDRDPKGGWRCPTGAQSAAGRTVERPRQARHVRRRRRAMEDVELSTVDAVGGAAIRMLDVSRERQ